MARVAVTDEGRAMSQPWRATASSQHGLITRQQLIESGRTRHMIQHLVDCGEITRLRPRVYRLTGAPPSWLQSAAAIHLSVPDAVLSHTTAARLWGFEVDSDGFELTTPMSTRVRLEGVRAHQSALLPKQDRVRRLHLPVTSAARTLVDVSPRLRSRTLRSAVDLALRERWLRVEELRSCVARLDGPGRRQLSPMHTLLVELGSAHEAGDSDLEAHALRLIISAGLPHPVLQHRVRLRSGRAYRIDLAYPDLKIAVELDGWRYHHTRVAFEDDRSRANELAAEGWVVIRFTASTPDHSLIETVRRTIEARVVR